jgi:hypothetical protein
MPDHEDTRSLGDLFRDLAQDAAHLVRQELLLARTEALQKVHESISAGAVLVASAMLAFAGLIILLEAAVYGLEEWGLEPWLAAVIVGGTVLLLGLLLLWKARRDLSLDKPGETRTTANLRKDLELVRGHVS